MKLVYLFFIGLLFNMNNPITAQVYRFKTSSVSIMEKDAKGKWGEWSDFKKAELIITLDGSKDRIIVNTREMQLYKILSYGQKIETEFDETVPFDCEDNNGGPCSIMIVTRKNQDNRMQIYINYNDVKMVYNVYNPK
jgi:hypothetical protein